MITWTADKEQAAVGPGEFLEFPVSLGPLPEAETVAFPTLQTYSDGEVVRWTELPQDGAELQRPAPILTLATADRTGQIADAAGDDAGPAESTGEAQPSSSSGTGTWLGLAALVAGLVGAALGGTALARSRHG